MMAITNGHVLGAMLFAFGRATFGEGASLTEYTAVIITLIVGCLYMRSRALRFESGQANSN